MLPSFRLVSTHTYDVQTNCTGRCSHEIKTNVRCKFRFVCVTSVSSPIMEEPHHQTVSECQRLHVAPRSVTHFRLETFCDGCTIFSPPVLTDATVHSPQLQMFVSESVRWIAGDFLRLTTDVFAQQICCQLQKEDQFCRTLIVQLRSQRSPMKPSYTVVGRVIVEPQKLDVLSRNLLKFLRTVA